MSDPRPYRNKDEWFALIQECRKSGLTDAQWCHANGIGYETFKSAVKRLRSCSYAVPSRGAQSVYDLTPSKQDVVRVDIIPDIQSPAEIKSEVTSHIDNSHTIEITIRDIHISLTNGADPILVSKTLSLLRSFS